ncbi:MAG TPA: protein translocase subunit SecD [Candidatus Dependentiae bacterium]|nr:protein translocase subunit SecD [Candidatus Dependentiae bacterium]HRQ62350.1 protein translocase subunit SecD [Candidatus Dependentiae bacterium]
MNVRRIFASELMIWLLIAGISLYFVIPLRKHIRLGMDLAGGTYLTLEVQTEKAVEAEMIERLQSVEARLKNANQPEAKDAKVEGASIILNYENANQAQNAALFLQDSVKDLEHEQEGTQVRLTMPEREVERIKENAVSRNIGVLRTRLDPYGTSEITIAQQGDRNIIVELPDIEKTLEAKSRIGKSAQLDFRLVEKIGSSQEDILFEYDGDLPSNKEILPGKTRGNGATEYYVVPKYTDITGRLLKDARAALGGQSGVEPVVQFTFNDIGARKFYELTSKNIGRRIAIVLDGVVISAPNVQSAIRESGSISGGFKDSKETHELAVLLQSGSYVAPVTFEEERQIGPSLGAESIQKGFTSCLVGLGLILLFSVYYYSLSGFFAFLALVYNLILVLVGLAWLKATLTLPGIAGMVLTVGMAIDASILIYECIKDELRKGASNSKAVEIGFSDAMTVILDANITTFIVGVVLYNTGSGPIQGFAVTMMLGILATLITGLFFLRSLFKFFLSNFNVQKLRI